MWRSTVSGLSPTCAHSRAGFSPLRPNQGLIQRRSNREGPLCCDFILSRVLVEPSNSNLVCIRRFCRALL
uniref:Uncharacterized protein n=1 Tax=Physcomitrium patens TaxID=3218 RepID=A0A2K1LBS5_PHYPA|nr:hypothetical protein PHYPA_001899 [Physcomitrium patens]